MIILTVQELIEKLEQLPPLCPVVVDGAEVTEVLIRDELFYTKDQLYDEGLVVKLY